MPRYCDASLTPDPIHLTDLLTAVQSQTKVPYTSCGATVSFLGTTRDGFEGKEVIRLEYEAYHELALKQLNDIMKSVGSEEGGNLIIIAKHRLGLVPPGETSIAIVVCSPHRQMAFQVCEEVLERVKKEVAIWKKEVYGRGDGDQWKENG